MRQAMHFVLERLRPVTEDFSTEPYETAWAANATLFVIIHEAAHANDYLEITPQISADGINWADCGETLIYRGDSPVNWLRLEHCAGSVRFNCRLSHGASLKITLQLHLKE